MELNTSPSNEFHASPAAYSTLPETPITYSTLPEAVPEEYQHGSFPQRVPLEREGESNLFGKEGQKREEEELDGSHTPAAAAGTSPHEPLDQPQRRRGRRALWVGIAIVVAVVIVGLVVGLTAGLLTRKNHHSGPTPTQSANPTTSTAAAVFGTPTSFSTSDTSQASVCRGTVCPSVLATARLADTDGTLFVFGHGGSSSSSSSDTDTDTNSAVAIWYRRARGNAWDGDWESLGGSFSSQPAATAVGDGRVDVFGTWTDGSIRTKSYQDGSWSSDWLNLGGSSVNAPAVCSWGPNNTEVFGTNPTGGLTHIRRDGDDWDPPLGQAWDTWDGFLSATPAAACGATGRVDVVSYGGKADMQHDLGWMHYVDGTWRGWEGNSVPSSDVGYRGDPALVSLDGGRTAAALGVGTDKQLYYKEWTQDGNYSVAQALGGSFESVPYVLVSPDGQRLDVLGVGAATTTDSKAGGPDQLLHKARVGGTWATDWEVLGGYFNSAPLAVQAADGAWVAVFGIGPGGRVIHGNWTTSSKFVWGEGQWLDDGGKVSTDWFRAGPAR